MTVADSLIPGLDFADTVDSKLRGAAGPLKLSEVVKGIKKPRNITKAKLSEEIQAYLEEKVRLGQVFSHPSAKNGAPRYWKLDESHIIRENAIALAAQPMTIPALRKELAKEIPGVDAAFVEQIVRQLISEDKLFEHPPKTKKGGPRFGAVPPAPPTPPLEQAGNKKSLKTVINNCRKILNSDGISLEELFQAIRNGLRASVDFPDRASHLTSSIPDSKRDNNFNIRLEDLILKAVENDAVLSLADLRLEMPKEYSGREFDETVLRLADDGRVIVTQDADPERFTQAEREQFIQDGEKVYTNVMKRS